MHDLSLYVLEMIENSLRAGAGKVAVRVWIEAPRDELSIVVEDDGPGLDVSVEQATDPFYTTKAGKRTGLGLPLFREAAEAAGGHLTLHRSRDLGGVAIDAVMALSNVDRPPLGDVVQTVAVMAATSPEVSLSLEVCAGADTCLATGAELAADGPVARRCAALLATADAAASIGPAATTRTGNDTETARDTKTDNDPISTTRPISTDPISTDPISTDQIPTAHETVDFNEKQRSVG
jgi:hypothetical protein